MATITAVELRGNTASQVNQNKEMIVLAFQSLAHPALTALILTKASQALHALVLQENKCFN